MLKGKVEGKYRDITLSFVTQKKGEGTNTVPVCFVFVVIAMVGLGEHV